MITVHKVEDGFVVAEHRCWITGVYATEEAARYAVTIEPSRLEEIWTKNGRNLLTLEDLQ